VSNSLAIATVTSTLYEILYDGMKDDFSGLSVTFLPLDKARDTTATNNQLNLFLYQVARNAAWTNRDMPRQVQPGETGFPPLPLNLYYLLTAFGDDDAYPYGHMVLGKAMSILHDHPVLGAQEIKAVISQKNSPLNPSDLDQQIERIRITMHSMPMDNLQQLWTGFATNYRLSVAYEVAVTLIESTRSTRTPLPVLARGQGDSGVSSQADLTPPLPTLESVAPPANQSSARLGETVTLTGYHFEGAGVTVRFMHPRWRKPVDVPPEAGGTALTLTVKIPNDPSNWPAGFYTVAVVVPDAAGERSTNQLPLALAPTIVTPIDPPVDKPLANPPSTEITVTFAPEVLPEQRASLLVGDREVLAAPHGQIDQLAFVTPKLASGNYYLRLRIDGVDSILVDRTVTPPAFDNLQKVTV